MDQRLLISRAGIMGVVRGVREIGHLNSEISGLEKRMRRNDISCQT